MHPKTTENFTVLPFLNAAFAGAHGLVDIFVDDETRERFALSDDTIEAFISKQEAQVFVSLVTDAENAAGICLAFRDVAGAKAAAAKLEPSFVIKGNDGSLRLVYLIDGSADEIAAFVDDLNVDESDDFYAATETPLPYGAYTLSDDDIEYLAEGEAAPAYSVAEFEAEMFEDGADALGMSADDLIGEMDDIADRTWEWNDATVYGQISDEVRNLPIKISIGSSKEEKKWRASDGTFGQWLEHELTHHKIGKKNGSCFVTGDVIDGKRSKNSMRGMYALGIDVDSGASMDDAFRVVQSLGVFAIFYTTHSHLSDEITIKQNAFYSWAQKEELNTEPTTENIRSYLRKEGKYDDSVIESAEFEETIHDSTGIHHIVRTKPIEKFRVIFPLAEPYVFSEQKMAQKDAILRWERMVAGMGAALGVQIDRSARDPSRLFYYPRHLKSKAHRTLINAGKLLEWEKITQADPKARLSSDPFERAADILGGRLNGRPMSPTLGLDLMTWAAERADGFEITEVFKDHCDDRLRGEISPGKFACECPFDENHSNSGDPEDVGCYIQDSSVGDSFVWHCQHDACAGKDRLQMLEKAMQDDWFSDDILSDDKYDCLDRSEGEEVVDEETGEVEEKQRKDTVAAFSKASKLIEKVTPDSPTEDIYAILELCVGLSDFELKRVFEPLAKKLKLSLAAIKDLFRKIKAEKTSLPKGSSFLFLMDTGFDYNPEVSPDYFCTGNSAVCQTFEVVGHCEDAIGDNATLTIRFEAMGKVKVKELRRRDMYGYGSPAIADLAAMNFKMPDEGATLDLLKAIDTPLTGQWVRRRGWHGDSFLSISGETFSPEGSDTLPLHMLGTDRKPAGANGTLEGWQNAVAPIWENNAAGREHMALALMAGMAGPAFSKCKPNGFRMLSFHGPTSRGKSLALKLMASVAWPPTTEGCYLTLRATSNGLEALIPDLSGHAIALDEGQHMKAEDANSVVFLLEDGSGKITANRDRSARERSLLGSGIVVMAHENPWVQKLRDAKVEVSPGFDARVLDISVAGVKDYPKKEATPLTAQLHGVLKHNGHALPLIVDQLLMMDPADIERKIARMTEAIVGSDALGLEARALETLAWVWFGGMLGKKAGLIPADFSLGKIIRWARDNRVADASKPVNERVLASLRTAVARRRKVDLYRWETFDPDANVGPLPDDVERVIRPVAGYFYNAQGGEELIILADALREMAGKVGSETDVAQYLHEAGYLRKSGKNLYHDKLPMRDGHADRVKNYRIKRGFYSSEKDDDADEES